MTTGERHDLSARLSIVIPAFDEEQAIADTLAGLRHCLPQAELIVVDDGSTDRTRDVVRTFPRVLFVRHAFNRGYGAALKSGMQLATRAYIGWFDADGEMQPEDLAAMADTLDRSNVAAVIGQRPRRAVSHVRTVGKMVIRATATALGMRMGHDLNCGLRVFRREAILPYLGILPDGFSASTTSTMVLAERGYPVAFHPVTMNSRVGTSKVHLRHGFGALAIVLRTVMLFGPLRIFVGVGLPVFIVGALYALAVALVMREGLPALGVVAMLIGVLLLLVGLLADQISQMRLAQLRRLDPEPPAEVTTRE